MLIMTIKGEEMKKLTQAVLVVAIGSCNSYAGGDIAIVDTEPTIVTIDVGKYAPKKGDNWGWQVVIKNNWVATPWGNFYYYQKQGLH